MKPVIKKMSALKSVANTLLIIGIIFLIVGILYPVPSRRIPSNYTAYVGGDAYNMIIEASIRSGEIAGAQITKIICIVFGISLILAHSIILAIEKDKKPISEEQSAQVAQVSQDVPSDQSENNPQNRLE